MNSILSTTEYMAISCYAIYVIFKRISHIDLHTSKYCNLLFVCYEHATENPILRWQPWSGLCVYVDLCESATHEAT